MNYIALVTLEDLERRQHVDDFEKFTGWVDIAIGKERKTVFSGLAKLWWRRGSNRKRIIAFWDMRPWAAASSLMAQQAPHLVRVMADEAPEVARRIDRLRS